MAEFIVRLGGYQGTSSVHTRAGHILEKQFLQRAGSACSFQFTENVTALGRQATDLFDMTEGDELDICYFASSYLVHRVPNLAIFDLPFQISNRAWIYRQLDGELGRRLAADISQATGFALIGFWDNGFRHFSNLKHAIRIPADCEGLSIRTMNNAIHQATFSALGFEPRYIDVKDYPEAVRTRKVDAQENPLTNTVNFDVHKTHPYVTMTGHFYGLTLVLGNRARIESWPAQVQQALREAMPIATKAQRGFAVEEDQLCMNTLKAANVEVIGPEGFDRKAFETATAGVVAAEAKSIDPEVMALVRA